MEHTVITIGREFGSGGHKVGQLLSAKLQIPYYDHELLMLSAKHGGLDEKKLEKFDEKKHNPYLYEVSYEGNENVKRGVSVQEALFQLQREVICEIGGSTDAVIVGRCADDILKRAGVRTVSVFIAAPFEKRIERTMMIEGIAEKEAVSMTKKKDKTRKRYYESRTGKRWGAPENYDLYFNTEEETFDEIADKIAAAYKLTKNT